MRSLTTLVLDDLTPVRAYSALRGSGPVFLFESVERGERWGRYSILGCRPKQFKTLSGNALDSAASLVPPNPLLSSSVAEKFSRSVVGVFPYDLVHSFGPIDPWPGQSALPSSLLVEPTTVVFDHLAQTVSIAGPSEDVDWVIERLAKVPNLNRLKPPNPQALPSRLDVSMSDDQYVAQVNRAKEYIRAGDAFQIVLARTFATPAPNLDPFDVYRMLRVLSPSPYMYLVEVPKSDSQEAFSIAGASPETLVRVENNTMTLRPIAGTRPRGRSPSEDIALGIELLADPKECAEHVMLVDLARNDIGRVALAGSVKVAQQMTIERYSHVMHLTSEVTGTLRPSITGIDVLRSAFPAGTLSGAPKIRAMQIIRELESRPRGIYGGAVGYLAPGGDLDLAIAIRTVFIQNGVAQVSAGAGVVEASDPILEALETRHKARSGLAALAALC